VIVVVWWRGGGCAGIDHVSVGDALLNALQNEAYVTDAVIMQCDQLLVRIVFAIVHASHARARVFSVSITVPLPGSTGGKQRRCERVCHVRVGM
jgi:hypothetical protein